MKKSPPRLTLALTASAEDEIRAALALLRAGAGERISGRFTFDHAVPPTFIGDLEIAPGPSSAFYLGAILRAVLFTSGPARQVADISARLWLTSHCTFCGALVPLSRQSLDLAAWCESCEQLRDAGELDRLANPEIIAYDQDTIMAFIRDPRTPEPIRDQFYLLMMEKEIARLGRDGYRESGRGAVLLDQSGDRPFAAYYLDAATVDGGLGWPNAETEQWVQEYDPAREVVVIFVKPGSNPEVYRIELNPPGRPVELTFPRPTTKITPSA